MEATEVMTLGRLGMGPQWRTNFVTRPPGQGPLRQTVNGLGRSGSLVRSFIPRPPMPPRPPGFGQVFIETPAIGPAVVATPALEPGAAAARFVTPGIGPAAFRTPSLEPGSLRVGRSLLGGLSRARRIALGQIDEADPAWIDDPENLAASVEAASEMTGEALDATFSDEELAAIQAEKARREGAIRIGRNTVIGWGVISTVSALASLYHGYRRNDSLGWGLWWGLMGAMFPVVTPVVALAQKPGFGKRRG